MRLDDVAPRTLLLGGLAGWAVLAWILALAGMGSRLPPGEPGAVRAAPVPSLPPPAADAPALGPISQYATTAARPLFATDRRPHPFFLQGEGGGPAEAPEFDLVLTSVLITPQATIAIVQKPDGSAGWRVRMGEAPESHPNWTLVRLEPRRAVFQGPEGQKELALRVFDGKGGATPTASAVPGPANVDPPATMGGVPVPTPPPPPPTGVDTGTKGPPSADANAPDPAQIEAIRRRIEQRRRELRQRADPSSPQPANLNQAPPTEIR
ncbi:type II secretion system protein XpsN [Lysobacter humi (ex Lee et al. 2017)]